MDDFERGKQDGANWAQLALKRGASAEERLKQEIQDYLNGIEEAKRITYPERADAHSLYIAGILAGAYEILKA